MPCVSFILLAVLAVSIWGNYRALFPGPGLYRVAGVFQERANDTLFLVQHETVPGLMEEMRSMAFLAESKDLLDRAGLRRGDRIRLTVRQVPDALLVVEIKKMP